MLKNSISLSTSVDSLGPRVRRSKEVKRQIVLETLVKGISIAAVARKYGINANLLHSWRWKYHRGELGKVDHSILIPVTISEQQEMVVTPIPSLPHSNPSPKENGSIELLIGDARLIFYGSVDLLALRCVIESLRA